MFDQGTRRRCTDCWPLAGAIALGLAASPLAAQQPNSIPNWAAGTDVRAQAPPTARVPDIPALKGTQLDGAPANNTTTITRPTAESRTSGQVTFQAHVTDDGGVLDQGVVWRIFRDKPGPDGKMRLLSQHREASPQLRLDVGDYMINVALGRANLTRRVTVVAGKSVTERFVISAGGLRVTATLASGEPTPDNLVVYSLTSDERDQFGNRVAVLSGGRPGIIMRLNAGLYQLQSQYGDANAIIRGEIVVEPGKVTEATIAHSAAKVTFKLVTKPGGDALADTQWFIIGGQGEAVKESAGALPSHVLAPGTYAVTAKRLGQTFKRAFSIEAGDAVEVEVIAQ